MKQKLFRILDIGLGITILVAGLGTCVGMIAQITADAEKYEDLKEEEEKK